MTVQAPHTAEHGAEGLQRGAPHTAEHGAEGLHPTQQNTGWGIPQQANSQLPKSTTLSSLAWTLTVLLHKN